MIIEIRNQLLNNITTFLHKININGKERNVLSHDIIFSIIPMNNKKISFRSLFSHKYRLDSYDAIEKKSMLNIWKCEKLIRNYYNISENETLYMFRLDISFNELYIPIVEYEIYSEEKKIKLDLNYCKSIIINQINNINITENNLQKHLSSSELYNDKCYSYENEGTDLILKDRRKEYIEKNLSLCENNCYNDIYDSDSKTIICTCNIKTRSRLYSDIRDDLFKLMINFKDIKDIININVIKCWNLLFNKNGIRNNIGNYIILIIILIHIILLFYINKDRKIFFGRIKNIIQNAQFDIQNKDIKKKKRSIKNKKTVKQDSTVKEFNQIIVDKNFKIKTYSKSKMLTESFDIPSINIINNNKELNFNNNCIIYNDKELNILEYNKAIKIDKRNYIKYYISLLKTKHPLIFTFYTNNDYNSKNMKICLFSFSFGLLCTINALFFNEDTIHKIYQDKGAFNFIYKIPKILYSTLITSAINNIASEFSLSENNIINLKKEKEITNESINKLIKKLILKIILYFIFAFILLIIFWFYLSCFCIVYPNSQIQLMEGTLISFGISLLYPFFLELLPGIFRIISINNTKKNHQCMYKISKIIQSL